MRIDFTEIYCRVDDFLKDLDSKTGCITGSSKPGCKSRLDRSEILTIVIGIGSHLMIVSKTTI